MQHTLRPTKMASDSMVLVLALEYVIAAHHTVYAEIFTSGNFCEIIPKPGKQIFVFFIFAKARANVGGVAMRGSFPDTVRKLVT